jgi:hypothetical protein
MIIRIIKSRRIKWAVHVICIKQETSVYRISVGKPEGKDHGELDIGRRIILTWILER